MNSLIPDICSLLLELVLRPSRHIISYKIACGGIRQISISTTYHAVIRRKEKKEILRNVTSPSEKKTKSVSRKRGNCECIAT